MNESKWTGTDAFLQHLELDERRSQMLADMETNPIRKKHQMDEAKRIRKLIERVKHISGGSIHTAAGGDQVRPERFMNKH